MGKIWIGAAAFICLLAGGVTAAWLLLSSGGAAPRQPAAPALLAAPGQMAAPASAGGKVSAVAAASLSAAAGAKAKPAAGGSALAPAAAQLLHGEVIYDARIALPPQAALDIKLSETEAGRSGSRTVAQIHKPLSGQSPLDWSLPIKLSALDGHKTYLIQAKISSGDTLLFVNAAPTTIDGSRAAYIIRLAKIDGGAVTAETHSLIGTNWRAVALTHQDVAPNSEISLIFDDKGKTDPASSIITYQASGSSGCNRYSAAAMVDEKAKTLQFSPLGAGFIACAPAIAAQEADFTALMAKVRRYKIDESGILFLLDGENNPLARFIAH